MSLWSRLANVFRGDRLIDDIDAELRSHLDEAIDAGRDADEARQAFGPLLQRREASRDVRLAVWLDALRADAVFGWRQLAKHKVTSAAAILSLGLAIGASTSAFRLIDALLLRPLPVADPDRLYVLTHHSPSADGEPQTADGFEYPLFRAMRAAVDGADLLAISSVGGVDLTFGSDDEIEKASRQYVSGAMFASFGLRPAVGRLLTDGDDRDPQAHPCAVLSYDYWSRRFGRDPSAIGRTFRSGNQLFEIVGVAEARFTGTEPGTMTDLFVPATLHPAANRADWSWLRTFVKLKDGRAVEPIEQQLGATVRSYRQEFAKQFLGRPRAAIDRFVDETVRLTPAASGVSSLQAKYGRALAALGAIVLLVLLIACANVANLLTARSATRLREMALRVSIGAGRGRLVQLMLVESLWLAAMATALGALFAWWSAPLVVSMVNPPEDPARLLLPFDARVLAFGVVVVLAVTALFGLMPALRAAAVTPASALRSGSGADAKNPTLGWLVAIQVAFCVLVLLVTGLFVTTFERLSKQPLGFSSERLLLVDAVAPRVQPVVWDQVADRLATIPGVERVAMASWPLLRGNIWSTFIFMNNAPQGVRPYLLTVSPGWTDALKIPLIAGRDFRASDTYPGVAIVNEAFARQYVDGANPIGRWFGETPSRGNALPREAEGTRYRTEIVGLVGNARYHTLRDAMPPTVYVPFTSADASGGLQPPGSGTFLVRTSSSDPMSLATVVRQAVRTARPEFRITSVRPQTALVRAQTVRERLLATLALFFGGVALLLAAVGLYGVVHHAVIERRHEIGIRIALGCTAGRVARHVTTDLVWMVIVGSLGGLALGLASQRYIASLLFDVNASDPAILLVPWTTMVVVAAIAALPPVLAAVRTDPVDALRAE